MSQWKYKIKQKNKRKRPDDPFAIQEGRIKDGKVGPVYRFGWAEEMYMPEASKKETVGRDFNLAKLPAIGLVLLFLLLVLLVKTAWLQIVKGDYYYSMAEGNRIRLQRIEPRRGIIYDRNMTALVRNKANFQLYIVPADLPDNKEEMDSIITNVSRIVDGITADEIRNKLAGIKPYSLEIHSPLFIADNIAYDHALRLYLESASWPGVVLANKTRREYPAFVQYANVSFNGHSGEVNSVQTRRGVANHGYGPSMSHIMGYIGKINQKELKQFGEEYLPIDYIGKMGIEYFWENELKGKSGRKQIEVDALGKEKKMIGQINAEDGHNLVLSLDALAQAKLADILLEHLDALKLNRAAAVVMDPSNGEVMAMVSWPAYNNNDFAKGITTTEYEALINHPDDPLFNRCISGEYPSGSTIKPVIAAAALEEGIISEHTIILSAGGVKIGQWFFPDWLPGGHGRVSVRRAIAESVNTFFYYIGGGYSSRDGSAADGENFSGLGVDGIMRYGKLFGLDAQTGIDLYGEANGFLPTKKWKEETRGERWYIGDTYHLAIGQGDILVTPLQVAVFTCVFANGGSLYRPHFVKQILSADDQLITEIPVEPIRRDFIDSYNIHVVRQGMRRTVTAGSASRLQSMPVPVAGKTGTAQWSTKNKPHAWFTGFAPYDEPELVITVIIEEGGEGSEVAVPIAEEFLRWYFGTYTNSR